jgi:hypothetical protein
MKKWVIGIVIVGLLAGFLTWQMAQLARKECSVCITFKGQRQCATAWGATPEDAVREAHNLLCARMAAGVTEVLACGRAMREDINCQLR